MSTAAYLYKDGCELALADVHLTLKNINLFNGQ